MAKRTSRQIFAQRVQGPPGLADRLLDLIALIPPSREEKSGQPATSARRIARVAAAKAASTAGALALPPGPLGWLTIAPELYAVWKIQAQMVADIAGVHGKHARLDREQMLYCLFSHTAASAVQDLVIRVGERYLVRRAPVSAMYAIINKITLRVAQRSAGRVVSRWIPAIGALGVAGYVYVDTGRVADAAMALFSAEATIEVDSDADPNASVVPEAASRKRSSKSAATGPAKAKRSRASATSGASAATDKSTTKPTTKPKAARKPPARG